MSGITLHARLALGVRDRELAETYAQRLDELGFSIVKVAPRGVTFEGTVELFERTFKAEIRTSTNGAAFEKSPVIPEAIEKHVDSVYFPTKPTFFP